MSIMFFFNKLYSLTNNKITRVVTVTPFCTVDHFCVTKHLQVLYSWCEVRIVLVAGWRSPTLMKALRTSIPWSSLSGVDTLSPRVMSVRVVKHVITSWGSTYINKQNTTQKLVNISVHTVENFPFANCISHMQKRSGPESFKD